jgi:putative transposase
MKETENGTKKFTKEEKLQIIEEVKEKGLKQTLAKYDLYPGTYYYWKRKHLAHGESGLDHSLIKNRDKEIKKLEKECTALKILLGEKELESKLKDEMLKKKYPELRRKI